MKYQYPGNSGLYRLEDEHDACGVGLVVNINGSKYHEIVNRGLTLLENMAHRGAEGSDGKTGDGAGIMVQIPHEFILLNGIPVPEKGRYGVGVIFLPKNPDDNRSFCDIIEDCLDEQGLEIMHTRLTPVDSSVIGEMARATEPEHRQIFITAYDECASLEDKLYLARKAIERKVMESDIADKKSCYIVSMSTSTMVYKGMLTSEQLRHYFLDLQNPYFTSSIALVHSRFSTNTFPTWSLAQPFRMIGHNGEINTIRGNRLWIKTRESLLSHESFGDVDTNIAPIIQPGMSDSASFDNVLEFFHRSGLNISHAMSMLIPESVKESNPLKQDLRSFYEYHSIFMEPWDGPATILFTDGRYAGGMLDRNGLRPCRWIITKQGMLIMASETGAAQLPEKEIAEKGRLLPGKIFMADTKEGRIIDNDEIKDRLADAYPYTEWLHKGRIVLKDIQSGRKPEVAVEDYGRMLHVFNYGSEDIEKILVPMAQNSQETLYSMGNDTALAVLARKPQRFFNYFKQKFAQVTNPPIDPIREKSVMSLSSYIGAINGNFLHPSEEFCKVVKLSSPVLSNGEMLTLRNLRYKGFKAITFPMTFNAAGGTSAMEEAISRLCADVETAIDAGYNYMIISDRNVDRDHAPIPSLLALSAIHHHLIHRKKREHAAILVESGEVFEVMHVALLIGYGASGVNPYMAFAILDKLVKDKAIQLDYPAAEEHYIRAIDKGMLKIMSKMGISTLRSYKGAAQFDTLGISSEVLDKYLGGGIAPIEGVSIDDIARDAIEAHRSAYSREADEALENFGEYHWCKGGEDHGWNPQNISMLKKALKDKDFEAFKEFCSMSGNTENPMFLRDLMEIRSDREAISIDEVESEEQIMKRFVSEAISFGAISKEAHETLAIAMNAIGASSNTGEGGEDPERLKPRADGLDSRNNIKQVASGRFGVDTVYLVNASEIQIKVAQGAKPGEGGQLPGFKVDEMIAKTRHAKVGTTLISPPPHHDIYSIEDLAQLIYDLRNVNPKARISVKLVSEQGVGTVAAGVAKAKADVILISGGDGGTGASPASSVKYAGSPVEIGLAQIQQALVINNLRGNVRLQADGGLKTAGDVLFMALLGAEEYGFGTAPMVAMGCIMCRNCYKNSCPMGIATQKPELRARFKGRYEDLVTYYRFIARQLRESLALMGYRSLSEIIGKADLLHKRDYKGKVADKVSLDRILFIPEDYKQNARTYDGVYVNRVENPKDMEIFEAAGKAISDRRKVKYDTTVRNTDRSVGAMLSGMIVSKYGPSALRDDTLCVQLEGSAGQSFGAFLCKGVTLTLTGDANDYLGKGLSGGRIIVKPSPEASFKTDENIIGGNTIGYGATDGQMYISGVVGERFCVRNSGATAVCEGTGDHGCEYMTGGTVVVLGRIGRNFAAGMSGGTAYVWDPDGDADFFCNLEMTEINLVESEEDRIGLQRIIKDHYRYTGSLIAKTILSDWDDNVRKFRRISGC